MFLRLARAFAEFPGKSWNFQYAVRLSNKPDPRPAAFLRTWSEIQLSLLVRRRNFVAVSRAILRRVLPTTAT
jgi:hypothetical protein